MPGELAPGRSRLHALGDHPQPEAVHQGDGGHHQGRRRARPRPSGTRTTGPASARRWAAPAGTPATCSRCRSRPPRSAHRRPEPLQDQPGPVPVGHQGLLGDLQLQRGRRQATIAEQRVDPLGQAFLDQCWREKFTATVRGRPARCQSAAWSRAIPSTSSVSGRIRPDSSASPGTSRGRAGPESGGPSAPAPRRRGPHRCRGRPSAGSAASAGPRRGRPAGPGACGAAGRRRSRRSRGRPGARRARFAPYIAMSARRSSTLMSLPCSGASAMPPLTSAVSATSPSRNGSTRTSRTLSATVSACLLSLSTRKSANSSPPSRASRSPSRSARTAGRPRPRAAGRRPGGPGCR